MNYTLKITMRSDKQFWIDGLQSAAVAHELADRMQRQDSRIARCEVFCVSATEMNRVL